MQITNTYTNNMTQKNQRTPKNELGQEAFLKILVTQLQNQDPLEGGDNAQYIAQLAQFSSLEQMQNLNKGISQMMYYQNAQYANELIGKHVTINNGQQLVEGVVEKVKMVNGHIGIVVNDIAYFVDQVVEVSDTQTKEPEEIDKDNLQEV